MNTTDIECLKRQILEDDYLKSCNAEFPKLYEDRLTHQYLIDTMESIDYDWLGFDWPMLATYRCCKPDADIVIDYPPQFPEERF